MSFDGNTEHLRTVERCTICVTGTIVEIIICARISLSQNSSTTVDV